MKKNISILLLLLIFTGMLSAEVFRIGGIGAMELMNNPIDRDNRQEFDEEIDIIPGIYWEVILGKFGFGMTYLGDFTSVSSEIPDLDYEWYFDWIGQDYGEVPDFMSMSRDEVFKSINEYSKMFTDMIEKRTVNYLDMDTGEGKLRINFDEIFFHLVNHATYHRGQIVMGLRILGKDVVMTDYVPHRIQITKKK